MTIQTKQDIDILAARKNKHDSVEELKVAMTMVKQFAEDAEWIFGGCDINNIDAKFDEENIVAVWGTRSENILHIINVLRFIG